MNNDINQKIEDLIKSECDNPSRTLDARNDDTIASNENSTMITQEWWERAAREAPVPIAFINVKGQFLFVNKEWSILTGHSFEYLVGERTCQEIIVNNDHGTFNNFMQDVCDGKIIDFYLKQNFIRFDGTTIPVMVYVHRQPPYGNHKGYIVFAKRQGTADVVSLQNSFENLQNTVNLSEHISKEFAVLGERVMSLQEKHNSIEDTLNSVISSGAKGSHINIGGDVTGQDKTGRDKNSMWIVGMAVLCVIVLGALVFDRYLSVSKDKIDVNKPSTELIESSTIN